MSKNLLRNITICASLGTALISFQNCSEMAFSSPEKTAALSGNPILPPDQQPPVVIDEEENEPPENENVDIDIKRWCSNSRTLERDNSNISVAKSLELRIVDRYENNSTVYCSDKNTASVRQQALAGRASLKNCNLRDGQYKIEILNESGTDLVTSSNGFSLIEGRVIGNLEIDVVVDGNEEDGDFKGSGVVYNGSTCDKHASPLYVDFRRDSSDTDVLSAPEDGVMFDILGANGKPAYSKTKISWFKKGRFAMLALPNEKGEVLGIDQLFGDNTLGPDQAFAKNGFLALAKYDSNKDSRIDESDAVYKELRLWFDYNRDGLAQKHELQTLEQRNLESIDLVYDENFREVDQYGNEIKYKSVVKMKNGRLKPIFDVWFKL